MTEEKSDFGFDTPAKRIEKEFAKAHNDLSQKKVDWDTTRTAFDGLQRLLAEVIEKGKASGEKPTIEHFTFLETNYLVSLVCKVGAELTEAHECIARCEKGINELKRRK